MVKQCGANEALKGLQDKTKEMADTLTDAVDLEKLEEFKAKAEGIADEVKGKLVSQIPKPKNLQVELGKLAEVKDAIGVGLAVAAIEKDFAKGLAAGVLTGALKNIVPPLLQGAAGVVQDAKDAISDALGGKEFDICKNIPNLELDEDGEPVEKAKVEAKPNEKADTQEKVEPTVEDNSKKPSSGGGKITLDEFKALNKEISEGAAAIMDEYNKVGSKEPYGKAFTKQAYLESREKNKANLRNLQFTMNEQGWMDPVDMFINNAMDEEIIDWYFPHYQTLADKSYANALVFKINRNLKSIEGGLEFAGKGLYRQFDQDDWHDHTKYPNMFIYQFFKHSRDMNVRDALGYGFRKGNENIAEVHEALFKKILDYYKSDEVKEKLAKKLEYQKELFS